MRVDALIERSSIADFLFKGSSCCNTVSIQDAYDARRCDGFTILAGKFGHLAARLFSLYRYRSISSWLAGVVRARYLRVAVEERPIGFFRERDFPNVRVAVIFWTRLKVENHSSVLWVFRVELLPALAPE